MQTETSFGVVSSQSAIEHLTAEAMAATQATQATVSPTQNVSDTAQDEVSPSAVDRRISQSFFDFTARSTQRTMLRLSNELPPIREDGADTLVYIGVPSKLPGQNSEDYTYMKRYFEQPYLMHSQTLRNLNSKVFDNLLGPKSARVERKLKKIKVHEMVSSVKNIKYYIDLTPVTDGDDALILLTELTVPKEALSWHQIAKDMGVTPSTVCGRDDLNFKSFVEFNQPETDSSIEVKRKLVPKGTTWSGNSWDEYDHSLEDEYSTLRHHSALVRLLHAAVGNDPRLDSAAKAWTFCMVAKFFDCSQHPLISHWNMTWLLVKNNFHFIQHLPAVSYRIGIATQSQWLVRIAFAILVGQQAFLDGVTHSEQKNETTQKPSHVGQILDDDDINRIDHAAAALTERIRNLFDELTVSPGLWSIECGSDTRNFWSLKTDNEEAQILHSKAKELLQHYIQRMIFMTMSSKYDMENIKDVHAFKRFSSFAEYRDVPNYLKPLTQQFWHLLKIEKLSRDYSNTETNRTIWKETQQTLHNDGVLKSQYTPYAVRLDFHNTIEDLNDIIAAERVSKPPQAVINIEDSPASATAPLSTDTSSPIDDRPGFYFQALAIRSRGVMTEETQPTNTNASIKILGPYESYDEFKAHSKAEKTRLRYEVVGEDGLHNLKHKRSYTTSDEFQADLGSSDLDSSMEDSTANEGIPSHRQIDPMATDDESEFELIDAANLGLVPEKVATEAVSKIGWSQFVSKAPSTPQNSNPSTSNPRVANVVPLKSAVRETTSHKPTSTNTKPPPAARVAEGISFIDRDINDDQLPCSDDLQPEYPIGPQTSPNQGFLPDFWSAPTRQDPIWQQNDPSTNATQSYPIQPDPTWSNEYQDKFTLSEDIVPSNSNSSSEAMTDDNRTPDMTDRISSVSILTELQNYLSNCLEWICTPGYVTDRTCDFDIPISEISTLLCLNDEEFKYLPMWAGGLDDGTGGVFNDGVEPPDAPEVEDGGFRGGAIGIIPGVMSTMGSVSGTGSEFEDLGTEVGISTVGRASRLATDGTATATVISMDE